MQQELKNAASLVIAKETLPAKQITARYDLSLQPGLIIDQVRQPAEQVDYGYPVGVTVIKAWDTTGASGY